MANRFCYADNQMKDICTTDEDGECLNLAADAAETRPDRASGNFDFPFLGAMVGGTTPAAQDKGLERKFDSDMHVYREARRGGERPDMITQEAVFKQQRIVEHEARMQERIDRG